MPTLFLLITIPLLILLLLIGYFVSAYILYLVTHKIFKITQASYKTSLLITLWQILLSLLVYAVLFILSTLIDLGLVSELISFVLGFCIFGYLLNKYYQTNWGKSVVIYLVNAIIGVIATVIVSLIVVIPIRYFVMQPFYIHSASMEPTFEDGDYLLINMFDKNYQRGDVVVFRYPKDPNQYFIKRVIGLPSENISIVDGKVLINGQIIDESEYLSEDMTTEPIGVNDFSLGADEYFVLGDTRDASLDSRRFGPIKKDLIVGKYWFTGLEANQ